VPRLRKVSPRDPGWTRRRAGRGFVYLDESGNRLTPEERHTPAVTRASYVDPRVIDLFNDGATISPALAATDTDLSDGTTHGKIERAVLNLLGAEPDSALP
jgi:hypothetical protein